MRRFCSIRVVLMLHLRDPLRNPGQLVSSRLEYLGYARLSFVPVCIGVASGVIMSGT